MVLWACLLGIGFIALIKVGKLPTVGSIIPWLGTWIVEVICHQKIWGDHIVGEQKPHLDILYGEIKHSPFCILVDVYSCALLPSLAYTVCEVGMVIFLISQEIKMMQIRMLRSWRDEWRTLLTVTYFSHLCTLPGNWKARTKWELEEGLPVRMSSMPLQEALLPFTVPLPFDLCQGMP